MAQLSQDHIRFKLIVLEQALHTINVCVIKGYVGRCDASWQRNTKFRQIVETAIEMDSKVEAARLCAGWIIQRACTGGKSALMHHSAEVRTLSFAQSFGLYLVRQAAFDCLPQGLHEGFFRNKQWLILQKLHSFRCSSRLAGLLRGTLSRKELKLD